MRRSILVCTLVLASICASTVLASAQVTSSSTDVTTTTTSPVAYVYVSNSPVSGKVQINVYAVSSNGTLSSVSGSPFATKVFDMSLNGRWLFATNFTDIDSFSIASNGALRLADTYTAGTTGGGPTALFLDHTGADLYDGYTNLAGTGNDGYQAYGINQTTGKISFINQIVGGPALGFALSFASNNEYAYSSSCYHFDPQISGVKRGSNGSITELSIHPSLPAVTTGGFYCPILAAADPSGHVAIAMQPHNPNWGVIGPYQIATYTVTSTGDLTTNSTEANMPKVAVGDVNDYKMSPSGKLLAIGGTSGLQVFHFNGANQATGYTGLLATHPIDQMFWDNANHLYAISRTGGRLYVFTITPTGWLQAPGSPHLISNPLNVIVLPKT